MDTLYERNGLIFWDARAILVRKTMENHFVFMLQQNLRSQNGAFYFIQVEAPILTPQTLINPQYTAEDIFMLGDGLVLRPETTMGSYTYARHLLTHHTKTKLPFVVWQHGLSFRREQDQVTKNMRLKQFYQLEFQIMFSPKTANDYSISMIPAVRDMIAEMIGPCRVEPSDRIPDYAEWTQDVIHEASNMEVCSMSKRKDFDQGSVLEVAIGTDRCVYHFYQSKLMVQNVSVRRDYRFSLEQQYLDIVSGLKEGVTPLTVMSLEYGCIIGWYLHGWKSPPPTILSLPDTYWWSLEC